MNGVITIGSGGETVNPSGWPDLWREIYDRKMRSTTAYHYESPAHLVFELRLREAIVRAAADLNRSGVQFETFKNSHCNEAYWYLNRRGGFELKPHVTPAQGIQDIFVNGWAYGFECATGIVIVLYKGVLDCIREDDFNRLFANLLLYDWHYDSDLGLIEKTGSRDSYPGDVRYFKNPDVNPHRIEWQGENTIQMDDDLYYGHGVGIVTSGEIISTLNRYRIPGSSRSAYLTDQIIHPDFLYLSGFAAGGPPAPTNWQQQPYRENGITASRIGSRVYLRY
ncbi:protein-glutamine gamma-glutamyltransferase [Paenibacillus rhizosphaerae]|uniref:Protein-glutamine gamma-glutamyltransferase n=1 Tax=Paenibacillus rhizosphaerae TaxID=297318 RepID=A0A1R1F2K6_9BACL|nr:protein-glutamine gamma-glutamyltransferase [Paenibacillus rhizosphaerae]OXL83003.1 protein-glutamine gamma-glutamyltransferase [Paenibacillus sp. SSG-1]UYO03411.1 protein-glutamine gamma-glutamyltransferase [Paenibacillus sp. PSB04]